MAVENTGTSTDIDIDCDKKYNQTNNDDDNVVVQKDEDCGVKAENILDENQEPHEQPNHQHTVNHEQGITTTKSKKNKSQQNNLLVEVLTGPHEGATFLLKPRPSRPCEIGRSKGKKFLSRGVSLHKDSEVSTCHGKFECKAGKMYYTDTGSTNGTSYMGEAIEDNVPMEIANGMVLVFGMSELRFTLVDN